MKASSCNSFDTKNTSSLVYAAIRQMILNQQYAPGERLVEAKVAETLNVSVTPVRSAFARLNEQGFIISFPYRGSFVKIQSHEEATNLIDARRIIEPAVAELAFPHIKEEDASFLLRLCEMADVMFGMGDLVRSAEYDVQFHDFFYDRCNNVVLSNIWKTIREKVVLLQCQTKKNCSSHEKLLTKRHQGIIQAVETSDLNLLKESIINHLDHTLKNSVLPYEKDITYGA